MHNWLNRKNGAGALVVYLLTGLALYAGLLNKSFSADDYLVVFRVTQQQVFFPQGFFRPLSDLTIWLNGLYGGFNSIAYYSFNLFLHCATAWAVYQFCRQSATIWKFRSPYFPFLGGLLFLIYPFHNEPLLWVVGRGASLAAFFGIIALCAVLSDMKQETKVLVFSGAYFLSMAAYETLIPLPVFAALLTYYKDPHSNSWNKWLGIGILIFLVHLILRYLVSGSLLGNYASHLLTQPISTWGGHWIRLMARAFVPPDPDTRTFVLQASGVFLFLILGIWIFLRRNRNREMRSLLLLLFVLLQLSLIVPVSFPVSTRTSETDRLLYFPAIWVSLLLLVLLKGIFRPRVLFVPAFLILTSLCVWFLLRNNLQWQEASRQSRSILTAVKSATANRKVLLINLPDEYNGAFMFRTGFREALLMEGIDTAKVQVVNLLKPQDLPGTISLNVMDSARAELPPGYQLSTTGTQLVVGMQQQTLWQVDTTQVVVGYWDKKALHWIRFPFNKQDD